jgi:transposase
LLQICGCGTLIAAKIIGETADVRRFRDRNAYARFTGAAPVPVWSADNTRYRLSRSGNRQLNAALHRIALTQASHHPVAKAFLTRRRQAGNTTPEAYRALKRRLSDVVYRALLIDAANTATTAPLTPPAAA